MEASSRSEEKCLIMNYYFGGTAGGALEAGLPRGARGAGSAPVAEAAADRGAVTAGRAGAAAAAAVVVAAGPPVALAAAPAMETATATATALVPTFRVFA